MQFVLIYLLRKKMFKWGWFSYFLPFNLKRQNDTMKCEFMCARVRQWARQASSEFMTILSIETILSTDYIQYSWTIASSASHRLTAGVRFYEDKMIFLKQVTPILTWHHIHNQNCAWPNTHSSNN